MEGWVGLQRTGSRHVRSRAEPVQDLPGQEQGLGPRAPGHPYLHRLCGGDHPELSRAQAYIAVPPRHVNRSG